MAKLVGAFIAYKMIKQLSMKWTSWDAYKLGLIDDKGNTLKSAQTPKEKEAMDYSIRMVKNIKKMIEKLPFGQTRIGTLAAAMFLLKEEINGDEDYDLVMQEYINIDENILSEFGDIEPILTSGKWVNIETGAMYHLSEDQLPDEMYISVPLYRVKNIETRKYTIVSEDCIRKL